ncbi:HNH endonuclease [Neobacillus sp. GCM10023253]|uniref:HNH endonuclease n=1 Tax=Neobacillus sp. GCM10023253 TaxID=3252644 RepID=UPI003618F2C3
MRFKYEQLSSAPLLVNSIYESGSKGNPAADDPLTKLFKVDGYTKSVGNRGGFRKSSKEVNGKPTKQIAYGVIYSTGKIKEWPDTYDKSTGTFIYYGDNREPGNDYLNTKQKGNAWLKEIFEKAYGTYEARKTVPPMFVFETTGNGLNVEFLGVAVPGVKGKTLNQSLELKTFGETGNQFQNYIAHLTMINIEPEGVSRDWLAQLKNINGNPLKHAPKEWINFVQNGPAKIIPLNEKNKKTIDTTPDLILPSEKEYLAKVRTTQGKFRENLLRISPVCKICGMNITELLVASHIKPWKDSDNHERIVSYNGFLLCPSHDAAFDKGYITFNNDGKIILSHLIDNQNKELLNLNEDIKIELHPSQQKYITWHRENVFKHTQ